MRTSRSVAAPRWARWPERSVHGRAVRAWAALAAGLALAGVVAGGGWLMAARSEEPGFAPLGWLIGGFLLAIPCGVIADLVVARRLGLSWPFTLTLLGGWAVGTWLVSAVVIGEWHPLTGPWTTGVAAVVALLWPLALSALWPPRARRRHRVAVVLAAPAAVLLWAGASWTDELGPLDDNELLMSTSTATLLGPAGEGEGDRCLGPFSTGGDGAFSYKIVDGTHEWSIEVPADRELAADDLSLGPPGAERAAFFARLRAVPQAWVATCDVPLHRWAWLHGLWQG